MSKHTAGPLQAWDDTELDPKWVIDREWSDGTVEQIAVIQCDDAGEFARLIAAAPAFHDTLQSIVDMNATPETAWVALCEAKDRCQRVLAKATDS